MCESNEVFVLDSKIYIGFYGSTSGSNLLLLKLMALPRVKGWTHVFYGRRQI